MRTRERPSIEAIGASRSKREFATTADDSRRKSEHNREMADPTGKSEPVRRGVVAVVVRQSRFLVIRRSAQVVAPGAYCFPGGGIEASECEAEALMREFHEELGAAIRPLRRIWRSTTRWHTDLAWWLGELEESAELVPNPAEVESIHWLNIDEMLALGELLESNREFLDALASKEIRLHSTE